MEFRLLRPDEIECRVSQCNQYGVQLLLYKDARCDMNILDETVGCDRWQRHHELINGNLFCTVGINFPTEEGLEHWVWKQDVGTESYTEKEKGQASDSFKRACFNWGIGRELYTAPRMFVYKKDLAQLDEDEWQGKKKYSTKDTFEVLEVQYDGKKIAHVKVLNKKTKKTIEWGEPVEEQKTTEAVANGVIDATKKQVICEAIIKKNANTKKILERYKIDSVDEMTVSMWVEAMKILNNMPDVVVE